MGFPAPLGTSGTSHMVLLQGPGFCLFTESHGSLMSEVLEVSAGSPAKGRPRKSLCVHPHLPGLLGLTPGS